MILCYAIITISFLSNSYFSLCLFLFALNT